MTIALIKRNLQYKLLAIVFSAGIFMVVWLSLGMLGSAYHPQNPSIDDSFEHWVLSQCPASNTGPGQTLGVLYFSPSTITSPGGAGSTGLFASAVMCTNSNYNRVRNIRIFTTGVVNRTAGGGNVSLSQNFYPPDIPAGAFEQFSGPAGGTANFSGLTVGWNCWDVEYDMSAIYGSGSSNIPGTGWMNLCVNYNPPAPAGNARLTVQTSGAPTSVARNFQSFGHTAGDCGSSFSIGAGSTARNCTSGTGNGIGYHDHGSAGRGGIYIRAPATVTAGAITADFSGWSGNFWSDGNIHCTGMTSRDRCVNLAPPSSGGTSTGTITANYIERDRPPTITLTPVCATPSSAGYVRVRISDPNGGTSTSGYRIDSGGESFRTSNDYNIPMGNWSDTFQYDPHNVVVRTRGVAPPGSVLGGYVTASTRYGVSATRGCRDRGFVATPTAADPTLLPDEESPTQAVINSGVSVTITPGSTAGVRLTTTRSYYIRRGILVIPLASPGSDNRIFNSGPNPYPPQTVSLPPVQVGDQICVTLNAFPGAGTVDNAGNVVSVTDGSNTIEACETVLNKPYFQIFSGDVGVGDGFAGGGCTANPNGTVRGFTRQTGSNYLGAGTQLGISSRGTVTEFMSASIRYVAGPLPPKSLTIANKGSSGTPGASNYGGGAAASPCIPDYWTNAPADSSTAPVYPNVGSSFSLTGRSGILKTASSATLSTSTISNRAVLYVNGDLQITGNIVYNNAASSWSSISAIPNLVVVVRGNIHISPSVSQLDGVFMAMPNGASGGHLYTCSNGSFVPPTITASQRSFVSNSCDDNQLTVNGQLLARDFHLFRTFNSLRDAAPRDTFANSDAAERFIESPDMWLSPPAAPLFEAAEYEHISNVPPIL